MNMEFEMMRGYLPGLVVIVAAAKEHEIEDERKISVLKVRCQGTITTLF